MIRFLARLNSDSPASTVEGLLWITVPPAVLLAMLIVAMVMGGVA